MQSPFRRAAASPAPAPAPAPMPMLSFPGKRPQCFAEDTSAAEKDRDLEAFMRSRRLVVLSSERAPRAGGGGEEVAANLRAYLRELDAVAPRFDAAVRRAMPTAPRKELGFAWRDAAGGARGRQSLTASLATERAVAMFALAAEGSRAAAAEDRRGVDGIRHACAALCDAAGALGAAVSRGHGPEVSDQLCHLSAACILTFQRLMLAQALECYFELAVAGGKQPALCSKVARQVSLEYDRVYIGLESPYLQHQQIDKSWAPHVQAKAAYFRAEACLRYAQALREQGDVGEAIARLRLALASLENAKRPIKRAAAAVQDAARWLRKETETELGGAERDNCRIYYMRVPAADALAELPALPQPLVRPTPVDKILLQGADSGRLRRGEEVAG